MALHYGNLFEICVCIRAREIVAGKTKTAHKTQLVLNFIWVDRWVFLFRSGCNFRPQWLGYGVYGEAWHTDQ